MPAWLQRLSKRVVSPQPKGVTGGASKTFTNEIAPEFSTRLAVDSPGAPGRAGAAALYQKWAARWQEF